MATLKQFSPPAFLSDFDSIPGQREAWHQAVDAWFQQTIAAEVGTLADAAKRNGGKKGTVQFYNPARFDPGEPVLVQPITWNAFPKELLRQYGRAEALRAADTLTPFSYYSASPESKHPVLRHAFYRPQEEYCEWHVTRDSDTGKILKVALASEPPEYWQAMFGDTIEIDGQGSVMFPGDKQKLLALYHDLVGPDVKLEDLSYPEDVVSAKGAKVLAKKGTYNPNNKWNSTHGIVHLSAPPNALSAEIRLGGDATILWKNRAGRPVVQPDALICCAGYGGPDRNSDPTIGSSVNALARLGCYVTLPDPVGLYMDHIDLSGWETPDGSPAKDCVKIIRGSPQMIERLLIQAPAGRNFTVGDIKIAGEPILYGGQVAECITVKLIGGANPKAGIHNEPLICASRCCLDYANAKSLDRPIKINLPCPPGKNPAFSGEGVEVMGVPKSVEKILQKRTRPPNYKSRSVI